ncbi:uncharacterized protein LOC141628296 [Silene latifolia]|uniref:uncharacterized protein LOC141628296 n=1 Tax=Silene latifolia TaxID=37657 RepID=UPI003D7759F9
MRECSTIADIISKYERASGQKINYSKSEVVFSKKREDVLTSLFSEEEVNLVLEILLSKRMPDDQMYWWPSRSGEYTVRSGYWLGMGQTVNVEKQVVLGTGEGLWKVVWGLRVPPKLTHFIWRACTGMLAVKLNFYRRYYCSSSMCEFCETEKEIEIHALFKCLWMRSLWIASGFDEIMVEAPCSSFREWLIWALHRLDKADWGRFLALLWAIWSIRNSRIFEDDLGNPEVVVMVFSRMVAYYQGYAVAGLVGGSTRVRAVVGSNA